MSTVYKTVDRGLELSLHREENRDQKKGVAGKNKEK